MTLLNTGSNLRATQLSSDSSSSSRHAPHLDVSGRSSQKLQVPFSHWNVLTCLCNTGRIHGDNVFFIYPERAAGCKAHNKLSACVMLLPSCLFALPDLTYVTQWPFARRHQARLLGLTADCWCIVMQLVVPDCTDESKIK